ncbi:MAG: hypothetical protein J6F30_11535, partial [Cellulosilyticum sp.]|nr:hypothetical protein [Cellulosilyticum sp.]
MFRTKDEQDIYFDSLEQIKLYDYDYLREHEPIEINLSHEYLTNNSINYLKFNNGYRDVYAFIVEKRYINDEVTDIIIEIDVIQTFMFDFDIKRSFVERKKCSIDEITDFDEGLDLGEHIIQSDTVVFNKESQYFAMFNGFKKQKLIYDKDNVLKGVELLPCATQKPLTIIDYIQYPCYFMPLASSYPEPLTLADDSYYEKDTIGGNGGSDSDNDGYIDGSVISKKIFRFLKGYEAFAPTSYLDSGGVPTIGYGTTQASGYWDSLFPSCTEEKASQVLAESIYNNYASSLLNAFKNDGVDVNAIKTRHFDAFLSLCYNCGLGGVTSSPMYQKFIKNMNDTTVTDGWESWYISDGINVLEGLKLRRQAEKNIFNNGSYEFRTIAIVGGGVVTDNN